MTNPATDKKLPSQNGGKVVLDYVLRDLETHTNERSVQLMKDVASRAEMGKKKYGHYLESYNGLNSIIEAYQEAIDCVMYLKQLVLESESDVDAVEMYHYALNLCFMLRQQIDEGM